MIVAPQKKKIRGPTSTNSPTEETSISTSLDKNIQFLKIKYNALINSDVILRELSIIVKGKKYNALLVRNRWHDEF